MRLFSYILRHDSGFSPNPFWGYCTLACCKPIIRRSAEVGDWIVGISPKADGNRLIYAMKISEKLTFDEYWADRRFSAKKPLPQSRQVVRRPGDNICQPLTHGGYRQLMSFHSNGEKEDPAMKKRDLSGRYALVSEDFYYFGCSPQPLPEELTPLIAGRGHRCHFSNATIELFLQWLQQFEMGVSAPPTRWKESDRSWISRPGCAR